MSQRAAVAVIVGSVPPTHFTLAGKSAVKLPAPDASTTSMTLCSPAVAPAKVKVVLAVRVL